MRKLFRSFFAVGALATLAACGDDVSITEPEENVEISGAPVTAIKVGDQVQLSANVAVTWSTSSQSVASVDPNSGLVTANAAGIASITATSTADQAKKASVTITVSGSIAPTVSIAAVNGFLTGLPVNPNNVAGQVNVVVNMDPGDFTVASLELLLDGNVVAEQEFGAAMMAAAVDGETANQVQQVTFPLNTADFNATTGAPSYPNGSHALSARVVVTGGGQAGSAAPTQTLIFNNVNTYIANLTLGGTTGQATGSDGLAYRRGSLTITVLPVIYAPGVSLASGAVFFGSLACDASGIGIRTAALAAGGGGFTATLAQTGTNGAGNVSGYEYASGTCTATESVTLNAVDNQGNSLFTGAVPVNASAGGIRLDNRAPAAPVVQENPNSRSGGWVNDAVSFTTVQAASNLNGMIAAAVSDLGVQGVTYVAKAAASTSVSTTNGAAELANPSGLAPSLANAYCVLFFAQDALGNRSSAGSGTCDTGDADNNTLVGVDRDAPSVAYHATSLAANARINTATVGGEFVLAASDVGQGGIGVSGVVAPTGTVIRRNVAAASVCQFGTVSGSNCVPAALANVGAGLYATTIAAVTTNGFFTFNATAFDAAGNSTPVAASRVVAHDATAPALSPASVSLANNFYNGGVPQSFSSFANDDLDTWKADFGIMYTNIGIPIFYGSTALNPFDATPLKHTNVDATFSVPFFYRQMQAAGAPAVCPATVAVGAQTKPSAIIGTLFDQGGNTNVANTPLAANSIVTGSATAFPGTMCAWSVTNAATIIGDGTGNTTPTSVTINADAIGPANTFNPPFARVDFYVVNNGQLELIGTAGTPSTTDPDSNGNRRHRYSISWTPGTSVGVGAKVIGVVGSTSNGDALITPPNNSFTIQP